MRVKLKEILDFYKIKDRRKDVEKIPEREFYFVWKGINRLKFIGVYTTKKTIPINSTVGVIKEEKLKEVDNGYLKYLLEYLFLNNKNK